MTGAEITRLNEIIAKMKVSTVTQFTGIFGTRYGFPISLSDYEFISPLMENARVKITYCLGGIKLKTESLLTVSCCTIGDCVYICSFSNPDSFAQNAHIFYGLIGVLETIVTPIYKNTKLSDIFTGEE